jgi:hypothetical protein
MSLMFMKLWSNMLDNIIFQKERMLKGDKINLNWFIKKRNHNNQMIMIKVIQKIQKQIMKKRQRYVKDSKTDWKTLGEILKELNQRTKNK